MKSKKMVVSILLALVVFVGIVIGIKWFYYVPELSIANFVFMPKNPIIGVDIETFSAKIQNTGNAKARNFDVSLFDDGKLVDSRAIEILDKGKSVDISFNYRFPTIGHHVIEMVVDCKNRIRERNKENNKLNIGVDVREPPEEIPSSNTGELPSSITTTIFKKGNLASHGILQTMAVLHPLSTMGKFMLEGKIFISSVSTKIQERRSGDIK